MATQTTTFVEGQGASAGITWNDTNLQILTFWWNNQSTKTLVLNVKQGNATITRTFPPGDTGSVNAPPAKKYTLDPDPSDPTGWVIGFSFEVGLR